MGKKIITHSNGVVETRETFYTEETIQQLRHQLEQAQTRISELEDKDWYEANIKQLEEQNDRLIQERDNLKQQLEETNAGYDFTYEQSGETIKELKQNQTQLAIQELEKVKEYMNNEYGYDCCADVSIVDEFIDNQIKELKGE